MLEHCGTPKLAGNEILSLPPHLFPQDAGRKKAQACLGFFYCYTAAPSSAPGRLSRANAIGFALILVSVDTFIKKLSTASKLRPTLFVK